jgi:hypothetical protein
LEELLVVVVRVVVELPAVTGADVVVVLEVVLEPELGSP